MEVPTNKLPKIILFLNILPYTPQQDEHLNPQQILADFHNSLKFDLEILYSRFFLPKNPFGG